MNKWLNTTATLENDRLSFILYETTIVQIVFPKIEDKNPYHYLPMMYFNLIEHTERTTLRRVNQIMEMLGMPYKVFIKKGTVYLHRPDGYIPDPDCMIVYSPFLDNLFSSSGEFAKRFPGISKKLIALHNAS